MKTKAALFRRAQRIDRAATVVITAGGALVILAVILILVLIAREALPLFAAGGSEEIGARAPAAPGPERPVAAGVGEYLQNGYVMAESGPVRFFGLDEGEAGETLAVGVPDGAERVVVSEVTGDGSQVLLWNTGAVTVEEVTVKPRFDAEGTRRLVPGIEQVAMFAAQPGRARRAVRASVSGDGSVLLAAMREDGTLDVRERVEEEDFLGNVTVEARAFQVEVPGGRRVTEAAVSVESRRLVAATDDGRLLAWELTPSGEARVTDELSPGDAGGRISAMAFVLGGQSIAVSLDDGTYAIYSWVPVTEGRGERELRRIRTLEDLPSAATRIAASRRNKSLAAIAGDGSVVVDHATTRERMVRLDPPEADGEPVRVSWSRRGDALAILADSGHVRVIGIEIPHPEASAHTLFGKVWYEGYPRPQHVWQSSSASEDFEPKMGLMPLIFGSVKGTVYAMIFAVPLALLGALYTNQFTRPDVRAVVKPAVEIMASIPSVIIGFLAALWLAPIFEQNLGTVFLACAMLPLAVLISVLIWQGLRRIKALQVVEAGYEFVAIVPVLLLSLWITARLGKGMETVFFDGDLKQWLFSEAGIRYDPRNCVVIAFALGFAVIPIVFTIAEDAFSNVPRSLTAASLALGASRWQTVWRVVLPSASPGIFAGIVIGLGRAVGETMIVLMATGNTPIIDWSIFNGMRTLSANIAVEIPEAPHGGTLYRVLFLSAMVLFLVTFVLNTVAEVVRQRLRARFSQFQ